jgi:hypothetical protein
VQLGQDMGYPIGNAVLITSVQLGQDMGYPVGNAVLTNAPARDKVGVMVTRSQVPPLGMLHSGLVFVGPLQRLVPVCRRFCTTDRTAAMYCAMRVTYARRVELKNMHAHKQRTNTLTMYTHQPLTVNHTSP